MAVNKVTYGDKTLIDLTEDNTSSKQVVKGFKFHDVYGESVTGSLIPSDEYNYLSDFWSFGDSKTYSSGVTATSSATDGRVTTTCSNSATAATTVPLVQEAEPRYLPAGTYKLSGAPAYQDRRARVNYSYWGLRIYPTDGRSITSQVIGYTSTDYTDVPTTATEQTNTYVWDKGYGATFTIDTDMYFYSSIYISQTPGSSKYSGTDVWTPVLQKVVETPTYVTYYSGTDDPDSSLGSDGDLYFKL